MNKKKSKSLLDRFLFLINSIAAILLLVGYLLPYISPIKAPTLAVLSLFIPAAFIINILFVVFWVIRLKKYFILSTLVIILGFGYISSIYKFSEKKVILNDDMTIMSYNVKMFNHYGWNPNDSIAEKAYGFINEKHPDILVIQEFFGDSKISFEYPHQYIKTKSETNKFGLAIYSTYPIINSGSLDFENSANNIIFSDIVKGEDTIRIYNVHLESLKISPEKENFGEKDSDRLMARMKSAFTQQGYQTEKFLEHQEKWKGKSVVCGDFNNTAFSWVYKQISNERQDAFKVAGEGTGRTYNYGYPIRIDFILPDQDFTINHFKTFPVKYSDHFPILARINLKEKSE